MADYRLCDIVNWRNLIVDERLPHTGFLDWFKFEWRRNSCRRITSAAARLLLLLTLTRFWSWDYLAYLIDVSTKYWTWVLNMGLINLVHIKCWNQSPKYIILGCHRFLNLKFRRFLNDCKGKLAMLPSFVWMQRNNKCRTVSFLFILFFIRSLFNFLC